MIFLSRVKELTALKLCLEVLARGGLCTGMVAEAPGLERFPEKQPQQASSH